MIVAQSRVGPTEPASSWGGVLVYSFSGTGASPVAITGIPASSLSDPVTLAYSQANSELLVGNRTGNTGVSSVISAFNYPPLGGFTPLTSISGNSLAAVEGLALNPVNGELFAGSLNGPISRFTFSGTTATPNGTIAAASVRGLAVSPDGTRLFYTTGTNTIHQYNLLTNTELTPVTVPSAFALQQLHFRGNNELYIADGHSPGSASRIVYYSMDGNDVLSPLGAFTSDSAVSMAFSPDLTEMFVPGHGTGVITEYTLSGGNWVFLDSFQTPAINGTTAASLGDILIIPTPEPASLAILGLGAGMLLIKRRRNA